MKPKSTLDRLLSRLLGNEDHDFDEIHIDKELVDEIIDISRASYPQEFVALLEGKIKNQILHIEGMVFLPSKTSDEGAVMNIFMKPLITGTIGSVHSHPGYSAQPSEADLYFFAKNGLVHFIIAEPYDEESLLAYDSFGNRIEYKII